MSTTPLAVALQVSEELPCPPQELVFRRYAPSFELGDISPFVLTASVFPSLGFDKSTIVASTSAENIGEALQKLDTLSLPTIPSDNIREDILRRLQDRPFRKEGSHLATGSAPPRSFPRCVDTTISCTCVSTIQSRLDGLHDVRSAGGEHESCTSSGPTVITGLTTGAILVWNLSVYREHVRAARREAHALADVNGAVSASLASVPKSSSPYDGSSRSSWGGAKAPGGVALLGCHTLGVVSCVVCCDDLGLVVSGGADGSVFIWDAVGAYVPSQGGGAATADSRGLKPVPGGDTALDAFAASIRQRHLLQVWDKFHRGAVTALGALCDTFLSGGADGAVCVWQWQACDPNEHGRSRLAVQAPQCVVTQRFAMSGWIRSVEAFHMQAVLDDEFIVTDDTGSVLRLQASRSPVALRDPRERLSRSAHATLPRSQLIEPDTVSGVKAGHLKEQDSAAVVHRVFVQKWHRRVRSEETRRLGLAATGCATESSNTVVRTLTIGGDRVIVVVGFSPVVHVLDTHKLSPVLRITHPSLTAEGSALQARDACDSTSDTVHGQSSRPRSGASKMPTPSPSSRSPPLRFVDILYVPEYDTLVLLDSRNMIFLYDRTSSRFTALAQIPTTGASSRHSASSVRTLLPCPTTPWRGGDVASQPSNGTAFLVVCDEAIYTCWMGPAEAQLVNTTAHQDGLVGMCALTESASGARALGHRVPLESLSGERIAFVTASRDITLCCLDAHLALKRRYVGAPLTAPLTSGDGSVPMSSMGEVTAFHYSVRLGYAMTGHEKGGLCLWQCDDELADVVACPALHGNTLSGLAEVCLGSRPARVEDTRFVTVGFDGFVALVRNVEKRKPIIAKRHRLSWSELVSVVTIVGEAADAVAVADQAGSFFVLETRELTPLFVCADHRLTVTPSPRWNAGVATFPRAAPVSYGHDAGVVSLCVSSTHVLSADESGTCLLWQLESPQLPPLVIGSSQAIDRADIDCVCALSNGRFVTAHRGGVLRLFTTQSDVPHRVAHSGIEEITAMTSTDKSSGSFALVLGSANGRIKVLHESAFSFISHVDDSEEADSQSA